MADLADLLEKTSRTFALSIPRLPEPTRFEVTIAYLLFRIADTFEDSAIWAKEDRIEALEDFSKLLNSPSEEQAQRLATQWTRRSPIEHDGYTELLKELPFVLRKFTELSDRAREFVRHHTIRTSRGMASYVARTDEQGNMHLNNLQELRDYCYTVAGIVGEVCTDLFLLDRPELERAAGFLRQRAPLFGEGLQLVNILKDASFDATEGRGYLPPNVKREDIFALARQDLGAAREYVQTLQKCATSRGLIAFNAMPVLLAFATLKKVEAHGPGSKISRPEVFMIVRRMDQALERGQPVIATA